MDAGKRGQSHARIVIRDSHGHEFGELCDPIPVEGGADAGIKSIANNYAFMAENGRNYVCVEVAGEDVWSWPIDVPA